MPTPNFLDGPSTPLPSARTDGCESDFKSSTSASCSGLKILVELGSHSIRRQGIRSKEGRQGTASASDQGRLTAQAGQRHSTGSLQAGSFGKLRGQCSVLLLTAQHQTQPKVRLLPSEVRLLLGPSAFQNEPPSEPDGSLRNGSVDTRGASRLPPGFSIWQRTGQKAAPLTPRIQNQGHTNCGHCQGHDVQPSVRSQWRSGRQGIET
jgi:hypothetical protein